MNPIIETTNPKESWKENINTLVLLKNKYFFSSKKPFKERLFTIGITEQNKLKILITKEKLSNKLLFPIIIDKGAFNINPGNRAMRIDL